MFTKNFLLGYYQRGCGYRQRGVATDKVGVATAREGVATVRARVYLLVDTYMFLQVQY